MLDNVIDAARQPFLDVAADIHGSLVYLDAGASEVAQLSLGRSFLLGLGAANVCALEQAHPDDALLPLLAAGGSQQQQAVRTLVVFTTALLTETHQQLVHLLMVHPHVSRCLICCSVSELAHAQLSPGLCDLSVEAYAEYAGELRQALAAARSAAGLPMPREEALALAVRHLPLHISALDAHTFVLPAAGAAASKAVAGSRAAGYGGADAAAALDEGGDEGAVGGSTGLSLLSHALADLSRVLGARLDPFALGPVSAAVAKELATLPQAGGQRSGAAADGGSATDSPRADGVPGGGAAAGSIGLVLVDRSLDLATPCMHSEHVLDVMFSTLLRPGPAAPPAAAGAPDAAATPWVSLRPADLRLDIPQLAPLSPLPPPPPATPPLQHPQPQPPAAQQPGAAAQLQDVDSADADAGGAASAAADAATATRTSSTAAATSYPELWPGGSMGLSLFHPEDGRWLAWLAQLWPKPQKDVLLLLRKWLKEALRAERITPPRTKLTPLVSGGELTSLATCLMGSPEVFLRHQPIIGLALAAAAALSTQQQAGASLPGAAAVWERLGGYERQLLLALPDGSQGAGMLLPMLQVAIQSAHPDQHRLAVDDVLQLLVTTYSLAGDRVPPAPPLYSADEAQLREGLSDVIMALASQAAAQDTSARQQCEGAALLWQHLQSLPRTHALLHEALQAGRLPAQAADVRAAVAGHMLELFQRLRWCAAARGKLRDVRRLMEVDVDTGAASTSVPLLRQVLTKILLQAENRDLTQPESGSLVAGLLTKGLGGLGRLGLGSIAAAAAAAQTSRRPRISEYPAVLLFVVGGISTADVRAVRQELEQHVYGHKPLVLLAGSSLLSPLDASRLFCSS